MVNSPFLNTRHWQMPVITVQERKKQKAIKKEAIFNVREREKNIESISEALPKMSEFDKGYLLGSAERMVSEKEKAEKENKDRKAGQGGEMLDYEKLRIQIRDMVTEVYEELKRESRDYEELWNKCRQYYRGLAYRDKNIGLYAKECFQILMENELRNVPIAHPSDEN